MTIAFSNPEGELASAFGASPRTVSFVTSPTSGNMLLVCLRFSAAASGVAVTDDQSNTYTQLHSFLNHNDETVYMFRSNNLTGTMPTSFSVSWTGGGSYLCYINKIEASGVHGTTPLDAVGTSTTGYGTSEDVSYTTANANEAILAYVTIGGRDITITEAGHSRYPATGSFSYGMAYNADLGAAGAKTLTYTWTTAVNSVMGYATLIAATGGGPTTRPMYAYAQQ